MLEFLFLKGHSFLSEHLQLSEIMNFMLKQCLSSRKQKQRALGDVHPSPIQCFPGYFLRSIFSTSLCFGFLIRNTRGLDKATQQHSRSLTSPFVSPTTRVVSFSYVLLFNLRTHVSVIQRAVNSLKARALLYTLFLKPYQILFFIFFQIPQHCWLSGKSKIFSK